MLAVQIEAHPAGAVLPVRVSAGARQTKVLGEQDGALKVSVTQVPEKGKANKAVVAMLSKALGVKKSQLELLTGGTSSHKRFLVRGVSPEILAQRVELGRGTSG